MYQTEKKITITERRAQNAISQVAIPPSALPSTRRSRIMDSTAALGLSQPCRGHSDIGLACS